MATTTGIRPRSSLEDDVLRFLLVVAIALPAVVFRIAHYDGEAVAYLYREPKKDAVTVLFWTVLAAFVWFKGRKLDPGRISKIITDPTLVTLSLLLGYFCLTRLWVTVPQNWDYEMAQYGLFLLVLLALVAWTTLDPDIPFVVERSVIASIAVVVGLGVLQMIRPGLLPVPINPFGEVGFPSLMGYKNPAALSVLAQIFLLAGWVFSSRRGGTRGRILLPILLAMEIFYLVSLQSRTALVALAVGAMVLATLTAAAKNGSGRRLAVGSIAAVLIAVSALVLSPAARTKAASAAHILTHPSAYLNTDRGTYLVNTLDMVEHHPFGVGLGDWQTVYPISRRVRPTSGFDDRFQVRRAHSDHVQILGETGWLGLGVWTALLATLLVRAAVAAVRDGDQKAAFLTAQVAAVAVAMGTDTFTEIPYNKLQFFLLVFLVLDHTRARTTRARSARAGLPARRRWAPLGATLVSLTALGGIVLALQSESKLIESATSTALFFRATRADTDPSLATTLLSDAAEIGDGWVPRAGHWKSLFRDHLALAHCEAAIGRRDRARRRTLDSLRLQPFNPQALNFMALLSDDPEEAAFWRAEADHVDAAPGDD